MREDRYKYRESLQQEAKKVDKFARYDEELLADRQGRKLFRSAAYAMGIGAGLFFLGPVLPNYGDEEKAARMVDIYTDIAITLMVYSIALGVTFFFFRKNVAAVSFLLNWIVIPALGIMFVMDLYGVMTHE